MDTHDSGRGFRPRTAKFCLCAAAMALLSGAAFAQDKTTLTITMAANPQMPVAERLIWEFYKENPDIPVDFPILPENQFRPTVLRDVATKSAQFDVVMIGAYEVPLWAPKGWIVDLSDTYVPSATGRDLADLDKPILDLISWKGNLDATPFYGSSSFMFYRKDLFQTACAP